MYKHVIDQALRDAQDVLWQSRPPTHNLSDDATVRDLRRIVYSPKVTKALHRAPDTMLVFELRGVKRLLAEPLSNRQLISQLWHILDQPELNRALGVDPNSRIQIAPKKPPA